MYGCVNSFLFFGVYPSIVVGLASNPRSSLFDCQLFGSLPPIELCNMIVGHMKIADTTSVAPASVTMLRKSFKSLIPASVTG